MGKHSTDFSPVTTVGLDIAKNVFQVCGADASGRVIFNQAVKRDELLEFFAALPTGWRPAARRIIGLANWRLSATKRS